MSYMYKRVIFLPNTKQDDVAVNILEAVNNKA
jgi:hypothetical protein